MGLIRTYQIDYLNQGTEQINYKVFDSEGTYVETKDEDILINCPEDLIPLNRSLVKQYQKPMLETKFLTELLNLNFINQNSQFLYDTDGWVLGTGTEGNVFPPTIEEANEFTVKPLSGNKYLRAQGSNVSALMIKSKLSENSLRQGYPLVIAFSYYVQDNAVAPFTTLSGKYRYDLSVTLDSTGNGTVDHEYNFEDNKWQAITGTPDTFQIKNDITGKWVGFSKTLEPFNYASDDLDKNIEVSLSFPNNLDTSDVTFIDNFTIAEKIDFNFNKVSSIRKRYSYAGGFSEKYETKNIMSNELKNDDNFVGQIEGDFERPRDSATKTLEAIITQEIMNDNRDYMTRYEGIFRNVDTKNVGLHNKLWINFGIDSLQEPVSCYLDSMKFDIKAAQYDMKMHVPNQDDDVLSTYRVIAE
jgi:hypothetical protein